MKKKIFMFILLLIIGGSNVFANTAPNVIVDGNSIYNGGSGSATFDKNTNTLILNNYSGSDIKFSDFPENSNITIELYGTNSITSSVTSDGILVESNLTNLKIKGMESNSSLTISNIPFGIYISSGNINIENSTLNINNSTFGEKYGIYTSNGSITIENSNLNLNNESSYDGAFGIYLSNYSDELKYINISNSKVKINNYYHSIFGEASTINIENSELEGSNGYSFIISCSSQPSLISDINIKNSKVTGTNFGEIGIYNDWGGNTLISGSEVSLKNINEAIFSYNGGTADYDISNITIDNSNISISKSYKGIYILGNGNVKMTNSNFNAETKEAGILLFGSGNLNVNGGKLKLNGDDADYNDAITLVSGNATFEDSDIDINGDWSHGILVEGKLTINGNNINIETNEDSIKALDVSLKNIKLNINTNGIGIDAFNNLSIESGDYYFTNKKGVPILLENSKDFFKLASIVHIVNEGYQVKEYSVNGDKYTVIVDPTEDINVDFYNDFIKDCKGKLTLLSYKKISFNANGGSGNMPSVYSVESVYNLPQNKFSAPSGKEFKGWSLSKNGPIIKEKVELTSDITLYAVWSNIANYIFLEGDKIEFVEKSLKSYQIRIDADYDLFEDIEIAYLKLIRDEDYTVKEGSTIIAFTESGIKKLNTLSDGEYLVKVNYNNGKTVKGTLIVKDKNSSNNKKSDNPETGDNIFVYCGLGVISLIGMGVYRRKIA